MGPKNPVWVLTSLALLALIEMSDATYIGCFKERRQHRLRAYGNSPGNYERSTLSVMKCRTECGTWNYAYAALTQGEFCFCGHKPPTFFPLVQEEGFCDWDCAGVPAEKCGGFDHVSVYKTALPIDGLFTTSADAGTTGLLITTTQVSRSFQVSVQSAPTDVVYAMDYGSGKTPYNDTDMFQNQFVVPGAQIVTAHATDVTGTLGPEKVSTAVLVQAPAEDVTVNCPPVVAVGEEFKCNASIRVGNRMRADINYGDGILDDFPIPDATWDTSGTAIPQHGTYPPVGNTDAIYFSSEDFTQDGDLNAVEAFVNDTGTAGTLHFLLLSPSCGGAYCEETNQCGACATDTCSVSDVYCPAYKECVPESAMSSGTCSDPDRSVSRPSPYNVKAVIPQTGLIQGWNYIDVSDQGIAVAAGDVMGVYISAGEALVGTRPLNPGELGDDLETGVGAVPAIGRSQPTNTQPLKVLARGHATKSTWLRVFHTFTAPNDYTLTVTATNDYITGSASNSTTVSAQVGIDIVIPECPLYWATSNSFTCTLQQHTGSNITYEWNVTHADTNTVKQSFNTTVPTATFNVNPRGNYSVYVRAYNKISDKNNVTTLVIQDQMGTVTLAADAALVNANHQVNASLTNGSDYSCVWNMGDATTFTTNELITVVGQSSILHNYTTESDNTVAVNCSNEVSFAYDDMILPSRHPIVNLQFDAVGTVSTEADFVISWTADLGTVPLADWTLTFEGHPTVVVASWDQATWTGQSNLEPMIAAGQYLVTLTGTNPVDTETISMNYTVDTPISGLTVTADKTGDIEILRMETITFTVDMDSGSSVEVNFIWNDGSANDTYVIGNGVEWPGTPIIQPHVFQQPGIINVTVLINNNLKEYPHFFTVGVLARLENLTLISDAPVPFVDGYGTVNFQVQPEGTPPAGDVYLEVDYGDGTRVKGVLYDPTRVFSHTYNDSLTYNVVVNASNVISYVMLYETVTIVVPVCNLALHVNPAHAAVGREITVGVSMDKGNDVTLYWNFDHGDPADSGFDVVGARVGDSPWSIDEATHTYSVVKVYTIAVLAVNPLGNTTIYYTLHSQNPVTIDDFIITTPSPAVFPPGSTGLTVDIDPLKTPPTDAYVLVSWGDGTTIGPVPYDAIAGHNWTHTYSTHGHYQAQVTIYNLATTETKIITTGVYEVISGVTVSAKWQPKHPRDGPLIEGMGASNSIFPAHRPVYFITQHTTGTIVNYLVDAVHRDGLAIQRCSHDSSPANMKFLVEGIYDVNVMASNPLESENVSLVVEIKKGVAGIQITEYGNSEPKEEKLVTLSFEDIGSDACVILDWDDGTEKELYTTDPACKTTHGINQIAGPISNPMNVTHTIKKKGNYILKVNGYSYMSDDYAEEPYVVSKADCSEPYLTIEDPKDFYSDYRQVMRMDSFSVVAKIKLLCALTMTNSKKWVIEKVDPSTDDVLETVDPVNSDTNTEMAIRKRELDLGLYRFTFTVSMDHSSLKEDFESFVTTYVEIIDSPIRALMTLGGTSLINAGHGVNVKLEPGSYSRDMNLMTNEDQAFDSFKWYCRQVNEEMPTNPDGTWSDADPSTPKTLLNAHTFPDDGGCFKDGPGRVNTNAAELEFNTVQMHENETYEFTVIVGKGGRSDTASVRLYVVPGTPPVVTIGPKDESVTIDIDGLQVNPSMRMALKGVVQADTDVADIDFNWKMYRAGLNGAWLEITEFAQYITSSPNTSEISVSPTLFSDGYVLWRGLDKYRMSLKATLPDGSIGQADIIVNVNTIPSGGSCDIQPKEGYNMKTEFAISCTNWTDTDGIKRYQFYGRFKNDNRERYLAFGDGRRTVLKLPNGPDYDDNQIDLYAKIMDSGDASATFFIGKIKVRPLPAADLDTLTSEYTAGETSVFLRRVSEANIHETCNDFMSYGSLLNQKRQNSKTGFAELDVSVFGQSYGYGEEATWEQNEAPATYNGPLTVDQRMEQFENQRDQRAQDREVMVKTLSFVTKSDLPSITLAATALTAITDSTDELTLQALKDISSCAKDMADTLAYVADESSKEDIVSAGYAILGFLGNAQEAAISNKQFPCKTDQERGKKDPLHKYDTDLESSRENFDNLGRGAGNSGLDRETSIYVQRAADPAITTDIRDATHTVGNLVYGKQVHGEEDISIVTRRCSLTVAKNSADKVVGKRRTEGRSKVKFPTDWCTIKTSGPCKNTEPLGYMAVATPNSPLAYDKYAKVAYDNHALEMEFIQENGKKHNIKNAAKRIRFSLPNADKRKLADPEDAFNFVNTEPMKNSVAPLMYSSVNVTRTGSYIIFAIKTEDPTVKYLVELRYGRHGNVTHFLGAEELFLLPRAVSYDSDLASSWVQNYATYRIKYKVKKTGKYFFGVGEVKDTVDLATLDLNKLNGSWRKKDEIVGDFTANYSVTTDNTNCFYSDPNTDTWLDDGMEYAEESDPETTVCTTNHLTGFGSSWAVQPNKIDFAYVFSNMDFFKNPTLYITEILILVVYILVAIWARRQDKKDTLKLGVTPMPDNVLGDKYLYEVVVSTGMRKNAGTDSKVHFILSGEHDETDVRVFGDSERKIFRRGNKDSFLMAVPKPLGELNYMRVWHDNAGKGKFQGWYLNYIMIHDIQTKQQWAFIGNEWFAVEESDGLIDRLLPIAGPEQMMETSHLFSQKATRNLSDDHLWFSVIARPPESRFTRLQRVSCALVLLFSSMLANAMFYERSGDGAGAALEFGPFALTPEQIYVGVISNLVVFPINFILVFLFRRTKPKHVRRSRIQQALDRAKKEQIARGEMKMEDVDPIVNDGPVESYTKPLEPNIHNINTGRPMTAVNMKEDGGKDGEESSGGKQKKKKFAFPWWMIILAWVLLWLTVLACAAFVTFYGVQFGDLKCKKWITSMVISFFTSIFLTQPIKVFLMALIFSLVCKKTDEEDDGWYDEAEPELKSDEAWLHTAPTDLPPRERTMQYTPPDPALLKEARENRLKELKMYDILREVLFYSFFLWILMVVSYGFRDPNAFFLKKALYNTYVDAGLGKFGEGDNDLSKARTMAEFFNWTKNTLIHGLRAEEWYNDDEPIGQRGFVADRSSRIMGYAVLRQLRIKPNMCDSPSKMRPIIPDCYVPYSMGDEDKTDQYDTFWRPIDPSANSTTILKDHFRYRLANELDGWPLWAKHGVYSGGGYVMELRGDTNVLLQKMDELEQDGWIDRLTRAVFMEVTTYNPQVNLFAITTLVAEFMKSGGVDFFDRVEPVNLLGYYSSAMLFQMACQVIYVAFIIFFIVKEIRKVIKEPRGYLKEPWNYVEMIIIMLSIAGVSIFFYRFFQAKALTKKFKETHGNAYMKFQYVGYWNELLLYMLGWLVFFATVKFIRLLRFNKRMNLLGQTLRHAAKGLLGFGFMFTIVFMAYSEFFYMIYFMDLYNFSTVIYTMETCLQMLVGKFNFDAMKGASPILGPATFFCYVVTVYYILLNMFLTILNESFSAVRADVDKQSNEHEMVSFMMGKFKQWTGLGAIFGSKKKETDKPLDPDQYQHMTEEEQIENFPDKIEQLLENLSKAYHNQDEFDSMFHCGKGKGGKKKEGDGTGSEYYLPRGKSGMAALRQKDRCGEDEEPSTSASPTTSNADLPSVN